MLVARISDRRPERTAEEDFAPRDRRHPHIFRRVGQEGADLGRKRSTDPLVGVDLEHPIATGAVERDVPLRPESRPRVFDHDRAGAACDLDRPVAGATVDDHHLIAERQALEAPGKLLLLVAGDHACGQGRRQGAQYRSGRRLYSRRRWRPRALVPAPPETSCGSFSGARSIWSSGSSSPRSSPARSATPASANGRACWWSSRCPPISPTSGSSRWACRGRPPSPSARPSGSGRPSPSGPSSRCRRRWSRSPPSCLSPTTETWRWRG